MKQILVPLPFGSKIEHLLSYAGSLATRSNAVLTFLCMGSRRSHRGQMVTWKPGEQWSTNMDHLGNPKQARLALQIYETMRTKEISFRIKFVAGSPTYSVVREANGQFYDLVLLSTPGTAGYIRYLKHAFPARVISEVQCPVFVVPSESTFNTIDHICYAVDLADYDPRVIQGVKDIALLFDAKLTIVHVNQEELASDRDQYRHALERTISDTLDYPKIYYKFFDHADPLGGIVSFLQQNNSNLLALTSRKKFSWSTIFSGKSFTQKITRKLSIPLIAFRKY